MAQVFAMQSEPERAAILWGAANHLRDAIAVPLESSREDLYTSLIPITRSQMGDESFDERWKKGASMKLEDAIEYALALSAE